MASVQTPPKRWDTMELVKGILPTAIGNKRDTGDNDDGGVGGNTDHWEKSSEIRCIVQLCPLHFDHCAKVTKLGWPEI